MATNPKHIAIAGNIGAGKTSLSRELGSSFDWEVHYEDTEQNPYLNDFYKDMKTWSFHLQVYFLNSRYRQILNIQQGNKTVIQDRTIYEDAFIFAPNLHDMGLMSRRDFQNYRDLFNTMTNQINPPDLLIYLKAGIPTLVKHIQQRGRVYEGNMSLDYLKKLNERYEEWISQYKQGNLLIIDTDELDFITSKDDLGKVVDMVSAKLYGFF